MKLHAKDDDNEYLHTANIKSYWCENEKKEKARCLYEENAWSPDLKTERLYSMFVQLSWCFWRYERFPGDLSYTNCLY